MDLIIEKFLEIVIILIAAKTGAELMRRINQPAVIGELIAGIIIGYYGLGLLPHAESGDVISTLAEIGIILLLFEVGLETDLTHKKLMMILTVISLASELTRSKFLEVLALQL